MELARSAKAEQIRTICSVMDRMQKAGQEVTEGILREYEIATEQLDELRDSIESIERSARKGGVGEMVRLKVAPEYGDWYYQKINTYDAEEDEYEHLYALYEGDDYIGEFGNVTAMKHYAKTGQRW